MTISQDSRVHQQTSAANESILSLTFNPDSRKRVINPHRSRSSRRYENRNGPSRFERRSRNFEMNAVRADDATVSILPARKSWWVEATRSRAGADLPTRQATVQRQDLAGKGAGKSGLGSFLEFCDGDNIEHSGRGFPGRKERVQR